VVSCGWEEENLFLVFRLMALEIGKNQAGNRAIMSKILIISAK
jgi:hypothetical protein